MNILFVLVLVYTVSALLFWENSLQKQNNLMFQKDQQINALQFSNPKESAENLAKITDKHSRKKWQYIGEGSVFLLIILAGALIVYLSFKRRLQLSSLQNNFMLSVTHELKSPIAGMRIGLETIAKRILSKEQTNLMLNNSIAEADRLNELCNNILLSTQIESKVYAANNLPFDIIALGKDCLQVFINRYANMEWVFTSNIAKKDVLGDEFLWRISINNLLENARKYACNSNKIILTVELIENRLLVKVLDQGPGIPDIDKKKIFQKFYRRGNENTRTSQGTGLGLYIVQQTAKYHKGSVYMLDNNPTGNIAVINVPM